MKSNLPPDLQEKWARAHPQPEEDNRAAQWMTIIIIAAVVAGCLGIDLGGGGNEYCGDVDPRIVELCEAQYEAGE